MNLTRHKWTLFAGGLSIVFVGLLLFVIWPIAATGFDNMQRTSALEQRIDRGSDWQETTDIIAAERAQLASFFAQFASGTQNGKGMTHALETLFDLADKAAVSIQNISPRETIEDDFFGETPIDVTLTGSYHNIAHFINDIEQFGYWIEPQQVQLSSDGYQQRALNGQLTLSVFKMKLPSEN